MVKNNTPITISLGEAKHASQRPPYESETRAVCFENKRYV